MGYPEPVSNRVQDSLISLVRHHRSEIGRGETVTLQKPLNALDHLGDREFEDHLPVLLQEMLPGGKSGSARWQQAPSRGHHQIVSAAPVHPMIEIKNAAIALAPLQQDRAGTIAEQYGGSAIERIDDGAHQI